MIDPTELVQLIPIAEQLSPERHPDQAIVVNQRIVQLDPSNAAAYVRMARGYQAQRKFAAALEACQEALKRNPQSTVAKKRLRRISEEWALDQQAQAIETYQEAFRRGVASKDQELTGFAIACLWRAVELSLSRAQSIACRTALAAAYRSQKDQASLDIAAAQYELVLRHAPGNLAAMTGLAAVLRDKRELSQARRLYEQVLELAPQHSHALYGLAGVLHDLGEKRQAQQLFEQGGKRQRDSGPRRSQA